MISVEITDTSTTTENVSFIFDAYRGISFNFFHSVFYPSSDFLLRQILPEETSVHDREPDSPLNDPVDVEGGLVVVSTQTIDSLVRQTTNGEGCNNPKIHTPKTTTTKFFV